MSKLQVIGMAIIALVIAPFYWAWQAIKRIGHRHAVDENTSRPQA